MKRTRIKKKNNLRRKSKQKISTIQRKLWNLCKTLIRKKYKHSCYTCGQTGLMGLNLHTGHMWAKASLGAFLKYDLRILRPQCYNCNINRGGMGADFYSRMLAENGEEYMSNLKKDRQITVKNAYEHYTKLIEEYSNLIK